MRAVVWMGESVEWRHELLGMPVGLRALCTAADAGAGPLEVAGSAAAQILLHDERLGGATTAAFGSAVSTLVLRGDALVAPALLRELEDGQAIAAPDGTKLAARVPAALALDPAQALACATPRPFQPERYRYAESCATPHGLRRAERALLASLVKTSDGPVSRHLNRPISLAISRRLVPLGVTPDQMTLVSALFALAAAFCAAQGAFVMHLIGAALFQLHSILDGCDGEIARLTRRSTPRGALLDSLVDDASNLLFFAGLSCGVAATTGRSWPLLAGGFAVVAYLAVIAVQYAVVLRATGNGDKAAFWNSAAGQAARAPSLLHELLRRNVFIALIFVAVAAGFAVHVVAIFPLAAGGALYASMRRMLAA